MTLPAGLPLNRFLLGIAGITAAVLLFWGGESLFHFSVLCSVPEWLAWIPAVSTSGVMLLSTAIAMNKALDQHTRVWAGSLAAFGIVMDVSAAMGQHVLAMQPGPITPSPVWGAVIGGLPPLMGGLLVHVISLVFGQHRREHDEAEAAEQEAERQRIAKVEAAAARQQAEADREAEHRRELDRQREIAAIAQRAADARKQEALAAEQLREATEKRAEVAREVLTAKPHLVVDNTRRAKAAAAASVGGEQVQAWLMEQHRAGVDYQNIGPAEIARATGAKPETCKSRHRAWKSAVARELELIAELAEAAG